MQFVGRLGCAAAAAAAVAKLHALLVTAPTDVVTRRVTNNGLVLSTKRVVKMNIS